MKSSGTALLVESSKPLQELARTHLGKSGYRVAGIASNVQEALECITRLQRNKVPLTVAVIDARLCTDGSDGSIVATHLKSAGYAQVRTVCWASRPEDELLWTDLIVYKNGTPRQMTAELVRRLLLDQRDAEWTPQLVRRLRDKKQLRDDQKHFQRREFLWNF